MRDLPLLGYYLQKQLSFLSWALRHNIWALRHAFPSYVKCCFQDYGKINLLLQSIHVNKITLLYFEYDLKNIYFISMFTTVHDHGIFCICATSKNGYRRKTSTGVNYQYWTNTETRLAYTG